MLHLSLRKQPEYVKYEYLATGKTNNFALAKRNEIPFDAVTLLQTCNKCAQFHLKIQSKY